MATKKKAAPVHPADSIDLSKLAQATFTATIFRGVGKFDRAEANTLKEIREKARELEAAGNGEGARKAIIHAIIEGRAVPIPASVPTHFADEPKAPEAPAADAPKTEAAPKAPKAPKAAKAPKAPAKPKAEPKAPKAAKKAAPKAKAAKAPKAPKAKAAKGGSKTDTVVKMLLKGATRKAIVEAVGGWQVDLKALAKRKGLKLKTNAEGVISAS